MLGAWVLAKQLSPGIGNFETDRQSSLYEYEKCRVKYLKKKKTQVQQLLVSDKVFPGNDTFIPFPHFK